MSSSIKINLLLLLLVLLVNSCKNTTSNANNVQIIDQLHDNLNLVIVEDGFTPPVASRIYAYCFLSYYTCLELEHVKQLSITGLNGLSAIEIDDNKFQHNYAGAYLFIDLAKKLLYKDYLISDYETLKLPKLNSYTKAKVDEIKRVFITRMTNDKYSETRSKPLHIIDSSPGTWEPTPPNFKTGIEPYWSTIMPFVIDSASQFKTNYSINFDTLNGSMFYSQAMEVYETVKELSTSQLNQAKHWDCNPQVTKTSGHMMTLIKQMNPGGHWLGIGKIAVNQLNFSETQKAKTYALTAISIADAFISCWYEKYTTNLIRPETYINRYIDPKWRPILETPQFPEYTSGHSVVSSAASTVLTNILGDNIAYIDSVNVPYGLPPRPYNSFKEAAQDAALSRLYGGIHYRPAIENGLVQGREVGEFITDKLALDLINN